VAVGGREQASRSQASAGAPVIATLRPGHRAYDMRAPSPRANQGRHHSIHRFGMRRRDIRTAHQSDSNGPRRNVRFFMSPPAASCSRPRRRTRLPRSTARHHVELYHPYGLRRAQGAMIPRPPKWLVLFAPAETPRSCDGGGGVEIVVSAAHRMRCAGLASVCVNQVYASRWRGCPTGQISTSRPSKVAGCASAPLRRPAQRLVRRLPRIAPTSQTGFSPRDRSGDDSDLRTRVKHIQYRELVIETFSAQALCRSNTPATPNTIRAPSRRHRES